MTTLVVLKHENKLHVLGPFCADALGAFVSCKLRTYAMSFTSSHMPDLRSAGQQTRRLQALKQNTQLLVLGARCDEFICGPGSS